MAKNQLESFILEFEFCPFKIISLFKDQDIKEKKEFFSFLLTIAEKNEQEAIENEQEAIAFYLNKMYHLITSLTTDNNIIKEAKEFFSFLLTKYAEKYEKDDIKFYFDIKLV